MKQSKNFYNICEHENFNIVLAEDYDLEKAIQQVREYLEDNTENLGTYSDYFTLITYNDDKEKFETINIEWGIEDYHDDFSEHHVWHKKASGVL